MVLRISLATTKSSTRSRALAKLSLTVSAANVRSFAGFLKIFKAEMKAMVIVMPIITAAIMSIPNAKYLINPETSSSVELKSPSILITPKLVSVAYLYFYIGDSSCTREGKISPSHTQSSLIHCNR